MNHTSSTTQPSTIEDAARRAVERRLDTLHPDDERAIERLILSYGICSDFALVDEVVALFTPDAVWDGTEFRFPVCSGLDEIRAHFTKECRPGMRQVHVMEPALLSTGGGPDDAVGFVPFNAMQSADGSGVIAAQHAYGIYQDRYRRDGDGWRIAERVLRLRLVRR
jgi:hypothetical protein